MSNLKKCFLRVKILEYNNRNSLDGPNAIKLNTMSLSRRGRKNLLNLIALDRCDEVRKYLNQVFF